MGSALWRTLVQPSGTLWQFENGASPFQSLVSCRRLGAGVRGADGRLRQLGACPSNGLRAGMGIEIEAN